MKPRLATALVLGCAGYGLRLSAKTSLLERRLARQAATGDSAAAKSVTQSTYGHALFGMPNSDLATAYYVTILVLCGSGGLRRQPVLNATRAVAWGTSCFSAYLIYALFAIMHERCPVCMRAHANNLALTVVLQFGAAAR